MSKVCAVCILESSITKEIDTSKSQPPAMKHKSKRKSSAKKPKCNLFVCFTVDLVLMSMPMGIEIFEFAIALESLYERHGLVQCYFPMTLQCYYNQVLAFTKSLVYAKHLNQAFGES